MKIDGLPSDLVSEILSRMPLRDAVRTSVLWKKWRYAWSKLPQLVFDDRLFEESIKKTGVKLRIDLNMGSHVPYLLLHHGHLRDKFTLAVSGLPNCYDIDQFILAVLKKGVKVLSVRMINRLSRLPWSIFAYCQQLTYLHLTYGVFEPPLEFNGFSTLFDLKLEEVRVDGSRLSSLISNSPLLRSLSFKVSNYNCGRLEIVAPNLESLTIEALCESLYFKNTPKLLYLKLEEVRVDGSRLSSLISNSPLLRSLNFKVSNHNCGRLEFVAPNLELLTIEALCKSLDFHNTPKLKTLDIYTCGDVDKTEASSLDMFCGRLPAIEELNMDRFYLKYVTGSRASSLLLNDLCNLKTLGMRLCFGILDEVVPALCLVKNAKSLVKFDILMYEEENTELNLLDVEGFSEITLDHLREVEVDLTPYLKAEMQFIEFILARSPVLEKLIIEPGFAKTGDKGLKFSKELSRFRCASPLVEIGYLK